MRTPAWVYFALCLSPIACGGGGMSRARHAADEGRHPDAVYELRGMEAEVTDLSTAEHARYSLLRGLSHLACGDLISAATWLARARSAVAHEPELLSVTDRGRLDAAWRSMGLMPGESARITSGLPAAVPEHSEPPHASRSARPTSPDSDDPSPGPDPE